MISVEAGDVKPVGLCPFILISFLKPDDVFGGSLSPKHQQAI